MKLYADNIDITATMGGLSWQNTIAELATTMNFEVAKLTAQHTSAYLPPVGGIISLVTNAEIFRGIVLTVDDGEPTSNKYTVCDFGFYLNKSKETYQFNNMEVSKLLSKICADFGVTIDSICDIPHKITKIYLDKTIADIIKDVLSISSKYTGYEYNFDVTPKGLRVYKIGDLQACPEFRLSDNTPLNFSPSFKGNVAHSSSIEDMKNSIKVITGDEKGYSLKATEQNPEFISKYGLLQEVVKVDPEKENHSAVAKAKLAELARIKETFSFEIIEAVDSYTRAGSVINIDAGNPGGSAVFLIEGTSHSIKNGVHYTKLDLRRV